MVQGPRNTGNIQNHGGFSTFGASYLSSEYASVVFCLCFLLRARVDGEPRTWMMLSKVTTSQQLHAVLQYCNFSFILFNNFLDAGEAALAADLVTA